MFLTHVFGKENPLEISCQQYPWQTFMERSGQNWYDDLSTSIELVKAAGFNRFEPLIESKEYLQDLMPLLKNLICPSIYVNSVLHTNQKKNESIAEVLEIARLCKPLGTEIVVTNPSPIQWGGMEDKSDGALMIQAEALDRLGRELRKLDMQLAYHNHDSEMRNSAREFHHMMLATDPHNVKLCLDAHWIYRGAGNSSVALFDIIKLYGDRIIELHLRQSKHGIWTETFGEGDINYARIRDVLTSKGVSPLIVLEQAIEAETLLTLSPESAHRESQRSAEAIFGP